MMAAVLSYLYLTRYTFVAYPTQPVSASTVSIVIRLRKQYRLTRSACGRQCTIDMLQNVFQCPR